MLSQNVLRVTIPPYKVSNPTNGGGHQIGGGGGVTRGRGAQYQMSPHLFDHLNHEAQVLHCVRPTLCLAMGINPGGYKDDTTF